MVVVSTIDITVIGHSATHVFCCHNACVQVSQCKSLALTNVTYLWPVHVWVYSYMCNVSRSLVISSNCIYPLQCAEKTFGQMVGGARTYYSFELLLEIRKEEEEFKKYSKGGQSVGVSSMYMYKYHIAGNIGGNYYLADSSSMNKNCTSAMQSPVTIVLRKSIGKI